MRTCIGGSRTWVSRHSVDAKPFILALFGLLLWNPIQAIAGCDVAEAVSLEGRVEVQTSDSQAWQPISLGVHLCPGDKVRLGADSRAGLVLHNDTLLRLDEHTSITINAPADDGTSWLDLIKGLTHFISRVKGSFEVRTPYVNASIEGTEFVVEVDDKATDIIVFEGLVAASNPEGSIELAANQSGRAELDQAPIRTTMANPRDAVAWTLYYPPLPKQADAASELAQQTITAIAENRIQDAKALASQAIENNNQSAAAYMAQSYVDQAMFDIPAALSSSRKAAELAPESPLVQARLAEVQLMTGDIKAARIAAEKSVSLDPNLSLTQSVLGFSSLRDVNLDGAMNAFKKAVQLDSSAPLPRLGLGLTMIRQGDLEAGRREIETAVLLDPNSALLRSYLGKAYYEEKRNSRASEQFSLAKQLDPNDPTAWFYDSILLQSENRPTEALRAQQKAIELNDQRGVYRSRLLLDQDAAARNTARARIYSDLGFEKFAITEGARALSLAPDNFSAHRFMAEIDRFQPQRRRAADSEALQSKLLQPLNAHSLRPVLSELQFADGPARFSYNEFNPLFTRTGPYLLFDGFVAGNSTWGEDIIATLLHDRFSISLGQYHFESDGFRTLDWLEKDILSALVQVDITPDSMIQIEYSDNEQKNGDLNQHFFAIDELPDYVDETDQKKGRIGFRHTFSNNSMILGNYTHIEADTNAVIDELSSLDTNDEIDTTDLQWIVKTRPANLVVGFNQLIRDKFDIATDTFPGFGDLISESDTEFKYRKIYLYSYTNLTPTLELTLASSYTDDTIDKHTVDFIGPIDNNDSQNQFNPKIGLIWDITKNSTLRTAIFRERPAITSYETLEPTQIAGFNQIYDDYNEALLTDAKRFGVGFDSKIRADMSYGLSALFADLDGFFLDVDPAFNFEYEVKRSLYNAYFYYEISNSFLLNVEYEFEKFQSRDTAILGQRIDTLKTHQLPVTLRHYFSRQLSSSITGTYYNQDGLYVDSTRGKDDFWVFDANITFNLPSRWGKISIGARNLFDKQFNYEDRQNNTIISPDQSNNINELSSERLIYGKFSLHF